MKPNHFIIPLLSSFKMVQSLSVVRTPGTMPANYGHYATYASAASNQSIDLYAVGYTGRPSFIQLDDSSSTLDFSIAKKFKSSSEFSAPRGLVEDRDLCAAFSTCRTFAADSTTTAAIWLANTAGPWCSTVGNAVWDYFTSNNYANTNTILQGIVIGIAVNAASTPIGAAILNFEAGVDKPVAGNDECNTANPENLANDYASAVYQFCSSIQAAQSLDTENHFLSGELDNAEDSVDGNAAMLRAFVASQAGNFGPVCFSLGFKWKRSISGFVNSVFGSK